VTGTTKTSKAAKNPFAGFVSSAPGFYGATQGCIKLPDREPSRFAAVTRALGFSSLFSPPVCSYVLRTGTVRGPIRSLMQPWAHLLHRKLRLQLSQEGHIIRVSNQAR
jgi:hypothetical protein